ncbi:hypothetical protein J1N35_011709, partial [Gossypium stocksii]
VNVATYLDMCRGIEVNILFLRCFQGYVTTPLGCVVTSKVVSEILHSTLYVATSNPPCYDVAASIGLACLLMVSCSLMKFISTPLGVIRLL